MMPEVNKQKIYGLVIIGAGPAGLSASIYASRYKIDHLVIGKILGGIATEAYEIRNYPGIENITGLELANKMIAHAKSSEVSFLEDEVSAIDREDGGIFIIKTKKDNQILTRKIILAMGASRAQLNVQGEKEFWGKGVTYCATCDAPLYRDKVVVVVGGGDSAFSSAVLLANYAQKIYLIYRRENFHAQKAWQNQVDGLSDKIIKILNNEVKEIKGDKVLRKVILKSPHQGNQELEIDGLFVEIGSLANSELARSLGVEVDDKRQIKITNEGRTNIKDVYGAGDITNLTGLKQIVVAAAQGAIASHAVFEDIANE